MYRYTYIYIYAYFHVQRMTTQIISDSAQRVWRHIVRDQGLNRPDKLGRKTLDESRVSHITTGIKTFRATPNMMIQRMAIS